MEDKQNPVIIILGALLITCVVSAFAVSAWLNNVTNSNAARISEAQARQVEALAIAAQAQVEQERAAGERAVLEAAADAVESNTALVNYYAHRGDTRTALVLVGVVGIVLLFAQKRPGTMQKSKVLYSDEGEL